MSLPAAEAQIVRVCALSDIPAGSSRRFDVGAHRIALVRIGDDVYAIGDTCSHADASLSEGDVDEQDGYIECHLHGAVFDVRTGAPLSLPATRPVPTYQVHIEGTDVYVAIG